MSGDRFEPAEKVTPDQAMAWLPPGDRIKTRLVPAGGPILVGADWSRKALEELFRERGQVDIAGPNARSEGYGLAVILSGGATCLFIKADVPESAIRFSGDVPANLN